MVTRALFRASKRLEFLGALYKLHAFVKRVKMYARWVDMGDVHLHQTRHNLLTLNQQNVDERAQVAVRWIPYSEKATVNQPLTKT
jgi:integrase